MILETIFLWIGGIICILIGLFIIVLLVYGVINYWVISPFYVRIMYILLFLYGDKSNYIGKEFKDKNGKKYIIKVKELN